MISSLFPLPFLDEILDDGTKATSFLPPNLLRCFVRLLLPRPLPEAPVHVIDRKKSSIRKKDEKKLRRDEALTLVVLLRKVAFEQDDAAENAGGDCKGGRKEVSLLFHDAVYASRNNRGGRKEKRTTSAGDECPDRAPDLRWKPCCTVVRFRQFLSLRFLLEKGKLGRKTAYRSTLAGRRRRRTR